MRAKHLPLLSLLMAIVMPFLFGIDLIAFDIRPASQVVETYWAKLFGDFLGCFFVIGIVLLLIKAFRALYSGSHSSGN